MTNWQKKKLKSLSMFGETIKRTNLGNATWNFLPMVWWFFYYYGDHFTAEACEKATFWKRELGALSYKRYLRYMYLLSWHVQELRQMIHTMHNISSDFPLKAKSLQLFFISDVCKYKRWICFSSVWYWRYVHVTVQFLDFLMLSGTFKWLICDFFIYVYEFMRQKALCMRIVIVIIIVIIIIITIVFVIICKKTQPVQPGHYFWWLR